ncbi:hypothetical protein [Bordetella petrii]|uniref:hypothetical protein n=1 Tax=Bordetella petrii TaxID=94624 RepID=UPI001E3335A4|nr:hypothetical protein [Bordetella petrii]MCD0502112.1 hypothetical protein [Bordetella petrii]
MSLSILDPIGHLHSGDIRAAYRAERPQAPPQTERVAGSRPALFARLADGQPAAVSTRKTVPTQPGDSVRTGEWLRDLHATHRLNSAVQAFIDEQAMLQARAHAANDLGTIQGLLPLQPYRFAMGNPPLQPQQLAAAAGLAPAAVGPVANVAPLRSATDDALGTGPGARVCDPARRVATDA